MANEAILRDRLESPIDYTVANGTAITKGAILKLTDPRTAVASAANGDVLAGIAAMDKVASDGRTRLAVFMRGIFDMKASGAIGLGEPVYSGGTNGANEVVTAKNTNYSGAAILGHAIETAADAEIFQVYVNVGAGNGI